jgi:hypothetical protein
LRPRKSCQTGARTAAPVALGRSGLREADHPEAVLRAEPMPAVELNLRQQAPSTRNQPVRLVLELGPEEIADAHARRLDQPVGAAFADRGFAPRYVRFDAIPFTEIAPDPATPGRDESHSAPSLTDAPRAPRQETTDG